MARRTFQLNASSVTLPRGTRVVLRVDVRGADDYLHRRASSATVEDVAKNNYTLATSSGRVFTAQRDQIMVQKRDVVMNLGRRVFDYDALVEHVIYAGVVGSQAWGLAGPDSDEDVRGCFVLPFDAHVSLWEAPDEIHHPNDDAAYWEIEKLLHQGLRGDANTLEALWTPLHKIVTPLGRRLIDEREMFVSMNVLGSFGRYAQSQFKKIERSLARNRALSALLEGIEASGLTTVDQAVEHLSAVVPGDVGHRRRELTAMIRSAFDRGQIDRADYAAIVDAVEAGQRERIEPPPHRPKNAYNLLRLLHSCRSWLETGQPLIEVTGPLRETLLAIKEQRTPIEETLRLAHEAAEALDAAAGDARLPEAPNYEAADRLLTACRTWMATKAVAVPGPRRIDRLAPTLLPVPLPGDVDTGVLRRFLEQYGAAKNGDTVWIALSGAHAYGFPSPDSDLDVKGVFLADRTSALGLSKTAPTIDFLGDFEEREHDLTLNELGPTITSLLAGNGNYVERFLGPYPLLVTEAGQRLRTLAQKNLSRRVHHHYRGFMRAIQKSYDQEAAGGVRKAKRLLYVYRTGLTGLHLLETGELVTDVSALAPRYGFDRVPGLVAIKAAGEVVLLPPGDDAPYLEDLRALETQLGAAFKTSVLPEEPAAVDELEALVIELRLL